MTEDINRKISSGIEKVPEVESSLSLDTVLEVLSNRHRRFALYALTEADNGILSLNTLIDEVVTLAAALDEDAVTRDQYQQIATDLYHWHLQVLADVGLIDYDARQETIRYLPHPTLETWVERTSHDELS